MDNEKRRMSLYMHLRKASEISDEAWKKGMTIGEYFEFLHDMYKKAQEKGGEDQLVREIVRSEMLKQLEQL